MYLYEDMSLKDALTFEQKFQNWLNLQLWEHGLEDPLLLLVVKKVLA
jgi:hypothetical protein